MELRKNISSIKQICDHFRVWLDAAYEVGPGRPKLLHEFTKLTLELAAYTDEIQLPLVTGGCSHLEKGLDELVFALQGHTLEGSVECVVVLLNEVLGRVTNSAREVTDKETVLVAYLSMFPEL